MKINCFTCKYGYEDERLGIPMCHHPKRFSEDCVNFNMHEEKETEESEKPINLDDAMKELDQKIGLVKERGTWDGVDVDKYMDEVRGREPKSMRQRLAEWSKTPEGREAYEKVAEEMRRLGEPGVDLEKEISEFIDKKEQELGATPWSEEDIIECARYFYSLGLKNAK